MLTLDQARTIVDTALEAAARDGVPPLGIVVLDEGGAVLMAVRQDGASMFKIDIATGKAWGAVAMGSTSRALFERAKTNPVFFTSLAATAQGRLLAQTGAVLVKDLSGRIIGAVGASGGTGDQDEACAAAGVRAAGFDPGLD
jgi:uncharacterized protein GlcG (DUF336 family)